MKERLAAYVRARGNKWAWWQPVMNWGGVCVDVTDGRWA